MEAGNLYGINETTTARRTKPTLSDHSVVFARWCHQHKNGRSRVLTCPVICGRLMIGMVYGHLAEVCSMPTGRHERSARRMNDNTSTVERSAMLLRCRPVDLSAT